MDRLSRKLAELDCRGKTHYKLRHDGWISILCAETDNQEEKCTQDLIKIDCEKCLFYLSCEDELLVH